MTSWDTGRMIYLLVLVGALVLWFVVENRESIGTKLKQSAAWGLIFLGTIAAIGLWGDIRQTVQPRQAVFAAEGRIELPKAPDGHFYATLDLNGQATRFVVDTGATAIVLSRRDAARIGLEEDKLGFFSEAMTANGTVRTAPVTLDSVALGPFEDRRVPAFVNEGEMDSSLLGMTYLQRFDRIEISGGKLVLERH